MAIPVRTFGGCELSIYDRRLPNPFDNRESFRLCGPTGDELIQAIWAHFNVTQNGNRELIRHGLSSPLRYESLSFSEGIVGNTPVVTYTITTWIPNREELFPRKPASLQDGIDPNHRIRFNDRVGCDNKKSEFGFTDLPSLREPLPEVVALYQAETFIHHHQTGDPFKQPSRSLHFLKIN